MKKNKMMRLASVLLVLCLLTTSVISGTFAKYTTQDSAADEARVAKWGVELQVEGNLFGDSYKDNIVISKDDTDKTITVQAVDYATGGENDVVAPGTENPNGFTFSLKGQPEVDGEVYTEMTFQNVFLMNGEYGVMIPVDANVVTADNFDEFADLYYLFGQNYVKAEKFMTGRDIYTLEDYVNVTDDYYPVVYKLTGNTSYNNANYNVDSLGSIAQLIADQLGLKVDEEVNKDTSAVTYKGTKGFETNTNLAGWALDGLTLTWTWAFDRDAAERVGDKAYYTNGADTILGLLNNGNVDNTVEGTVVKLDGTNYKAAVEFKDYCVDTQFSIDITATQVTNLSLSENL